MTKNITAKLHVHHRCNISSITLKFGSFPGILHCYYLLYFNCNVRSCSIFTFKVRLTYKHVYYSIHSSYLKMFYWSRFRLFLFFMFFLTFNFRINSSYVVPKINLQILYQKWSEYPIFKILYTISHCRIF